MLLLHIILHVITVLLYYHKHFVIISLYSKAKKYLVQPKLWPVLSARTKRHPTIKAQRPGKYKRARTTEDERQFVLDAILANNEHRLRPTDDCDSSSMLPFTLAPEKIILQQLAS